MSETCLEQKQKRKKKERKKKNSSFASSQTLEKPSSWKSTAKRKNAYHTKFMTDLKLSKEYNIYLAKKEREREKREI